MGVAVPRRLRFDSRLRLLIQTLQIRLLPEHRPRHISEHHRIAALDSLRQELESSRLRSIDADNPPSHFPTNESDEEMSQPLTQPPDVLDPQTLSPLPSPPHPPSVESDYIPLFNQHSTSTSCSPRYIPSNTRRQFLFTINTTKDGSEGIIH